MYLPKVKFNIQPLVKSGICEKTGCALYYKDMVKQSKIV